MEFVSNTFPLYDVLASRKPVTGCGNEYLQSQYLSRAGSRIRSSRPAGLHETLSQLTKEKNEE